MRDVFNRNPSKKAPPNLGEAPAGMLDDAGGRYTEIYAGSRVAAARLFVLNVLVSIVAIFAIWGMVSIGQNNVAVPFYVEVNKDSGVAARPVRVEAITPSDAVIKAELARWITKVFTIDSALTPQMMREANQMTMGLGTAQFAEFRTQQKILERMTKDASLQRRVTVTSVDASSQPGVAFIFLTTQEAQGIEAQTATNRWRVTLKYDLVPPRTEEAILANPLGLFVTSLNVTEEGASK